MKGKSTFTKDEASVIEKLIEQKCNATTNEQKSIRKEIRLLGFYASDFNIGGGYTVADFRKVVTITGVKSKDKTIKISKEIVSQKTKNNNEDIKLNIDFKKDVVDSLRNNEFEGFITIQQAIIDKTLIPSVKGVYMIYMDDPKPNFVSNGTGGFFKNEDPNVTIETLKQKWVKNSLVLYIGKAGTKEGKASLQSRLKQYFQFGKGKKVGHRGGRYIWQLKNPYNLKVCWVETPENDPREVEKVLIAEFFSQFNQLPFANLVN